MKIDNLKLFDGFTKEKEKRANFTTFNLIWYGQNRHLILSLLCNRPVDFKYINRHFPLIKIIV